MEAILDSSFIISCFRRKIDFFGRLREEGFSVKVPKEVMQELKDLKKKATGSREDRFILDMALKMIGDNKEIKMIRLGNKGVDAGLIEWGKKGVYIASLDAVVKRSVPNRIFISDSKNDITIERA